MKEVWSGTPEKNSLKTKPCWQCRTDCIHDPVTNWTEAGAQSKIWTDTCLRAHIGSLPGVSEASVFLVDCSFAILGSDVTWPLAFNMFSLYIQLDDWPFLLTRSRSRPAGSSTISPRSCRISTYQGAKVQWQMTRAVFECFHSPVTLRPGFRVVFLWMS